MNFWRCVPIVSSSSSFHFISLRVAQFQIRETHSCSSCLVSVVWCFECKMTARNMRCILSYLQRKRQNCLLSKIDFDSTKKCFHLFGLARSHVFSAFWVCAFYAWMENAHTTTYTQTDSEFKILTTRTNARRYKRDGWHSIWHFSFVLSTRHRFLIYQLSNNFWTLLIFYRSTLVRSFILLRTVAFVERE